MTSPVAIRRSPAEMHMPGSHIHHQHHHHNHAIASMPKGIPRYNNNSKSVGDSTPSSHSADQILGTTPGGTNRIVYSREQLLLLATSPLSQTITPVPQEISRSPEQTSPFLNNYANKFPTQLSQSQGNHHAHHRKMSNSNNNHNSNNSWTVVGGKSTNQRNNKNENHLAYSRSPNNTFNFGNIGNAGSVGGGQHSSSFTQKSSFKPRSPGNAFNFGGKNTQTPSKKLSSSSFNTPSSFKERLEAAEAAAAKQQKAENGTDDDDDDVEDGDSDQIRGRKAIGGVDSVRRNRLSSNSSGNSNKSRSVQGTEDDQFAMEM